MLKKREGMSQFKFEQLIVQEAYQREICFEEARLF